MLRKIQSIRFFFVKISVILLFLQLCLGFHVMRAEGKDEVILKLQKVEKKIAIINEDYEKLAEKKPKNEGAIKIHQMVTNLLTVIKKYKSKSISRDSLQKITVKSIKLSEKYDTPKAQAMLTHLKELKSLIPSLPIYSENNKKVNSEPANGRKKGNKIEKNTSAGSNAQSDAQSNAQSSTSSGNVDDSESQNYSNEDGEYSSPDSALESEPQPNNLTQSDGSVNPENGSSNTDNVSETSTGSQSIIYFLFVIVLASIVAMGFYFYSVIRRIYGELNGNLKRNYDEHDSIKSLIPGTDGPGGTEIKMLQARIKSLENNIQDFLQMIDQRVVELEKKTSSENAINSYISNLPAADSAILMADEKRAAKLEERLTQMEKYFFEVRNEASTLIINVSFDTEIIDSLIDGINALALHTDMDSLKIVCVDAKSLIQMCLSRRNWSPLDLYTLASLAQLSYVSMINEQQDEPYQQVAAGLRKLGFIIHDMQTKQPALSPDLAENISYEAYLTNPKVKGNDYPNFKAINASIEKQFQLDKTSRFTTLCVLQPSVSIIQTGRSVTLAKGKYVVNM